MKGSVRWMAVELIVPLFEDEDSGYEFHTKETDIWAFGMIIYVGFLFLTTRLVSTHHKQELLIGKIPFYNLSESAAIMAIYLNRLPEKPRAEECSFEYLDDLWNICQLCWARKPAKRPDTHRISNLLSGIRNGDAVMVPIESTVGHIPLVTQHPCNHSSHIDERPYSRPGCILPRTQQVTDIMPVMEMASRCNPVFTCNCKRERMVASLPDCAIYVDQPRSMQGVPIGEQEGSIGVRIRTHDTSPTCWIGV